MTKDGEDGAGVRRTGGVPSAPPGGPGGHAVDDLAAPPLGPFDRWAERFLEAPPVKAAVVLLIALSLLPSCETPVLHFFVFLPVFLAEFVLRSRVFAARRRWLRRLQAAGEPVPPRHRRRFEAFVLGLDFLAVLSFLPIAHLISSARLLRLVRLVRLVLVIRYAADLLRDFWTVVTRRERLGQLLVILATAGTLAFVAAALLLYADPEHRLHEGNVLDAFWWAFLQLLSSDNIVKTLHEQPAVVAASVLLTVTGIFLMAFVIGLGTNVVAALVVAARQRPVDLEGHAVLVAPTRAAQLILRDLRVLAEKNPPEGPGQGLVATRSPARRWRWRLGARRIVFVGPEHDPPPFLLDREMRGVSYRSVRLAHASDVGVVGAAEARSVILVPDDAQPEAADDHCLSTALALSEALARAAEEEARTGELMPRDLFLEVRSAVNVPVARRIQRRLRRAGVGCQVLDMETLSGRFLAQHVIDPGIDPIYEELLSARGNELYAHPLSPDEARRLAAAAPAGDPAGARGLRERSWRLHRVIPLGLLTRAEGEAPPPETSLLRRLQGCTARLDLGPSLPPPPGSEIAAVLALAPTRRHLLSWRRALDAGRLHGPETAEPAPAACALAETLEYRARRVRRVLLVGDHPAVAILVIEMIRFLPGIEIRILPERPATARDIAGMLAAALRVLEPGGRVSDDGGTIDVRLRDGRTGRLGPYPPGGGQGASTLLLDPTDLDAFDRVVFLSDPGAEGGDDRTTVRFLRIADAASELGRCGLVVQVETEERAALLTETFRRPGRPGGAAPSGGSAAPPAGDAPGSPAPATATGGRAVPLSVLAAEQIRSHLLAQVVYAPGIGPVLEELLSERGCEIVRLDRASGASLPADPVSFGDVQIALARRLPGPVTALAWVVERGGAARTVLNPDPADRPGADRIAAVYALADASLLGGGPAER